MDAIQTQPEVNHQHWLMSPSKIVENNLCAFHKTREAFIQVKLLKESREHWTTVLEHKVMQKLYQVIVELMKNNEVAQVR